MLWVQSEIRALWIIWSVNEYPVPGVQIVERGRLFFLREFFSRALLSERLEQTKRLVNEYTYSMNYYDYYGLYYMYCCSYYN